MPVFFVTASARRRDWIGNTSRWNSVCSRRMKCVSPMHGACRHGEEVVVACMPMPEGHSQDRPSSTRGQSQHVEAKSKPSRVATSVTAPPSGGKLSVTMRTHKRFYFMRMVAKDGSVLGRGIMRKERWMVFGHSLGRGFCDHAITFYGLSLPPTDTCSQDFCCFSKLLFKSTFLAFQ